MNALVASTQMNGMPMDLEMDSQLLDMLGWRSFWNELNDALQKELRRSYRVRPLRRALLVAVLLIVAIPFSIWSIFARRGAARASVTIEGSAKRIDDGTLLPVGEEPENQHPPK